MRHLKSILAGLLILACAISCDKENPEQPVIPSEDNLQIKFSTSLYNFTKATDTAFENNDQISVYIFKNNEAFLKNGVFTFNNGSLTSSEAYEWYEESDVEASISAFYPAIQTQTTENLVQFAVNENQSTAEQYTKSDLMFAQTASKPTADAVNLPFKHALSKIVVTIDNQLSESIESVFMTDLCTTVSYDITDPYSTLQTLDPTGTIKAMKRGENTWELIVAPQTASPKLALTTASEKQYTYVLPESVTFSSGKVSSAQITVTTESIYTSFTSDITDWITENELEFSQGEGDVEIPSEDPKFCRLIVRANTSIKWYHKYIYSWIAENNLLSGEWPGTKLLWDKEDGDYNVYYHDFPYSLNGSTINYIISGKGNEADQNVLGQTNDLTVTLNGAETTVTIESSDLIKK